MRVPSSRSASCGSKEVGQPPASVQTAVHRGFSINAAVACRKATRSSAHAFPLAEECFLVPAIRAGELPHSHSHVPLQPVAATTCLPQIFARSQGTHVIRSA